MKTSGDLIYWITKAIWRVLVAIFPVEYIVRLFWLMPSRLVGDILRWYGAEVGDDVKIMLPIVFHDFQDRSRKPFQHLHIGAHTFVGRDCFIDLDGQVTIEENVTIAMGVTLITHMDVGNSSVRKHFPRTVDDITIHQGAYIGARTTIIAPVEVGLGALVGAMALVISSVPPGSVFAGVPAKKIRELDDRELEHYPHQSIACE